MDKPVKQPTFDLFYEKTSLTESLKPHLIEVTYTDYLSDQSDEITLTFEDREEKWIHRWFPTQGDKLHLKLGYVGEPLVDMGKFEIDEIEYSYPPSVVTIRALSTGISKANRTLKPKAYENTTLADIVRQVAKNLKLKVTGEVRHIPIKRVTQYQERDVEFLTRLAHEYHHSFKIVNDTLVFMRKDKLGERDAIVTLNPEQVISIRLRDRIKDAVKEVKAVGYDAQGKKTVSKTKPSKPRRPSKKQAAKANADTLKVVGRGETQEQIDARADAALDEQTEDLQAGEIQLLGNPKLVAGNTLLLTKLGMFSGKYLIKSARHSLSRTSGFTTQIDIKMVEFTDEEQGANNANS